MKRINITERQSVQFQFQATNLLNHAQYSARYISDVQPTGLYRFQRSEHTDPKQPWVQRCEVCLLEPSAKCSAGSEVNF